MQELPSDQDMRTELVALIAREGITLPEQGRAEVTLDSMGLASIDVVMLLMAVEERFNVYLPIDEELSGVLTLDGLLDLLVARIKTAEPAPVATGATGAKP